ncbi:MAG: UbiA family prenyltransferase [Chloroflexi bacterium]|nr:UbiA family prenyltransferase [Chloroflexota bacterium]
MNQSKIQNLESKLRLYWTLTKSLQTGLLLATGLTGYMTARCPVFNLGTLAGVALSLFLAIAGSTLLNMWWDCDIDAKMLRTQKRPLCTGAVSRAEVLRLGLVLALAGVGLAVALDALYGLIVFAGLFFDVVIYSIWLKRRTCWGIVWGGISGGMPILAGRALGVGSIDGIGLLLCLGILFWIPTHILTYSMKYFDDYRAAGIPTFASTYGFPATRLTIAVSSVFAALAMGFAAWLIGVTIFHLGGLALISVILFALAALSVLRPTEKLNFGLFKFASIYMLLAMVLMVF